MIASVTVDGSNVHTVGGSVRLNRFDGLGSPAPRDNRPARAREHGAADFTTYYEPRVFNLEGYVVGSSLSAMWPLVDTLKQQFALNGLTHILRWVRETDALTYRAVVSVNSPLEIDLPLSGRHCEFAVTLVAADPRIYNNTLDSGSFASPATSVTVTNDGNFNTAPVVTFTGAGTNPGLRNGALTAENELRLTYTMVAGDTIVVDHGGKTVKLNGASRPDILNLTNPSHFWKLAAGSNALTLLGTAASVLVEFRDSWI